MTHLRMLALGLGMCVVIAVIACGNGVPESSGASAACTQVGTGGGNLGTAKVTIDSTDNLVFVPEMQTAHVGDIIQWTNSGTLLHNVTFDVGTSYPCLTDPEFSPAQVWQVKFTKPGTYNYECTIHAPGMKGTLVIT